MVGAEAAVAVRGRGSRWAWLTGERLLIGASLTRVLLGSWAVYFYLLHYPARDLLWGPRAVWPYERFAGAALFLNPLRYSTAPLYFEVLYHAAIVVALAYTFGVCTRLAGMAHWVMIWSLQERNPLLGDGGDNIMRIVLLFLVLADAGRHFSIDAARRPRSGATLGREVRAVAHTFGVFLAVAQLAMLYMSTGLYKAMGELWQNGTALYYILRVDEFSLPGLAEHVYRNPYLVVLGTYGTVLFEVTFLPALFNRWTRYLIMAAGVAFHAGIALFMGLITFSWSILSLYPLLVNDQEYMALARWVRRRLELAVFYDGWCPFCVRSIHWLSRWDLCSLVRYESFREAGVTEQYGLDRAKLERRIHSVTPSGTVRQGIDVMLQIAARSLFLWPILLPLYLARLAAGQRAYDVLAARRLVITPGGCVDHCLLADGDVAPAPRP